MTWNGLRVSGIFQDFSDTDPVRNEIPKGSRQIVDTRYSSYNAGLDDLEVLFHNYTVISTLHM